MARFIFLTAARWEASPAVGPLRDWEGAEVEQP